MTHLHMYVALNNFPICPAMRWLMLLNIFVAVTQLVAVGRKKHLNLRYLKLPILKYQNTDEIMLQQPVHSVFVNALFTQPHPPHSAFFCLYPGTPKGVFGV